MSLEDNARQQMNIETTYHITRRMDLYVKPETYTERICPRWNIIHNEQLKVIKWQIHYPMQGHENVHKKGALVESS